MKILVADDNRSIPKKVEEALKGQGIEVVGVGHGEAAVKKLPELLPDLVLADVFMPVRNGYEVCDFVKNDQRFAHIPVVLLVGAFDPIDQHEVKRVRADGLLKKPFDPPDDLIQMVRAMIEKSAQARPAGEKKEAGPKVSDTIELSADEMNGLIGKGTVAPAPAAEPEQEEYAVRPARIEFGEGSEAMAFGELLETPVEEGPKVVEEGPRAEASGFRASSVPDIQFAGAQEEEEEISEEHAPAAAPEAPSWGALDSAPEEPAAAAAPAETVAEPEAPQWGGIEVPAKEPTPDEPPIKVEFGSSEPIELVTEESSADAPSLVDSGPLPELATSPVEFMSSAASPAAEAPAMEMAAAPVMPAAQSPQVDVSEMPVQGFSIPAMEEIAIPPVAEPMALPPAPEPPAPPPVAFVEPAPAPEQIVPPALEIPKVARPFETAPPTRGQAPPPSFTGNTDAFARPHMDPAAVDAIVEKVIARLQRGVLDQITRDILRPIVEALVAREMEDKQ
ncbi:MAG: response regulator [Acidobacteria bacterium]|nr:response regulator [Acidobacteriota bacterium]MBI3663706.1 response regulator [Acidobacteriota bacterium]